MKKRFVLFVTVFFALTMLLSFPALALVEQSDSFYVADYANVLSDSTESEIINQNGWLEQNCNGAQIVIVAVEYMDGMYADEYAVSLFNKWGVGSGTENNGMLLAFATKENKGWLTAGKGISDYNAFSDNMANNYLEAYFWDHYDRGDYDSAVNSLLPKLIQWYSDYYGVSSPVNSDPSNEYYPQEQSSGITSFISRNFVLIMFIMIILINILMRDIQRYRYYYIYRGLAIPPYHIWYLWSGPHRHWNYRGPRGPRGPGSPGGFGGGSGYGGFGGFGGSSGGFGGGFGGSSGGFGGGFGGGSGHGGGGFSGGGGGGRR